eukprot:767127-Hanusia_phi.AAC.2
MGIYPFYSHARLKSTRAQTSHGRSSLTQHKGRTTQDLRSSSLRDDQPVLHRATAGVECEDRRRDQCAAEAEGNDVILVASNPGESSGSMRDVGSDAHRPGREQGSLGAAV